MGIHLIIQWRVPSFFLLQLTFRARETFLLLRRSLEVHLHWLL